MALLWSSPLLWTWLSLLPCHLPLCHTGFPLTLQVGVTLWGPVELPLLCLECFSFRYQLGLLFCVLQAFAHMSLSQWGLPYPPSYCYQHLLLIPLSLPYGFKKAYITFNIPYHLLIMPAFVPPPLQCKGSLFCSSTYCKQLKTVAHSRYSGNICWMTLFFQKWSTPVFKGV